VSNDLWGSYLTAVNQLCIKHVFANSDASRVVVDGYDETNMHRLEQLLDDHCVDFIVDIICTADVMKERMIARGRETADEAQRRVDKFVQNELIHAKQLKSFMNSGRVMELLELDSTQEFDEALSSSGILETLQATLSSKQAAGSQATEVAVPQPEAVAAIVCASAEFTALLQDLTAKFELLKAAADATTEATTTASAASVDE
jgi:hypothetical protein